MNVQQPTHEIITHNLAFKSLVLAVQQLSLSRNMETVMRIVRNTARELTGADGATFVLRENNMCYYADENAIGPLWKGQRFPMQACISGWSMINRMPAVIGDIYSDSRIPFDTYRPTFVKSLVMVPIRSIDPIGAIGTYWAYKRIPTEEEVTLLQSLADITAVTMENIKVYNELEQRVKERTSELIDSLNREKEMSAMKTHFVSMVSHEFKTPLSSILSSAGLLESYQGPEHNEKRTKHLNRIKSSVKHLIGMVNDFLEMDQMEQGKTEVRNEHFNLQKMMADVIEEIEGSLKSGQHIQYTHCGNARIVQDKKILHNILLNLISNAAKYSGENQCIDLYSEVTNGQVIIKVKDYGIGIPDEDQPYIFGNYFRARNAGNVHGTGLGLNIVKRYMELINGTIEFTSRCNEGSTFTLKFKNAE
jgi:signal transduction histidine kinase